MYLVSYQKQNEAPVIYVASETSLMATVNKALEESAGTPVIVSLARTL